MKRIKRRVFTPDWQDVPFTISHDDFIRLRDIAVSLSSLSSLEEIDEMNFILSYVHMQNYIEYLNKVTKEVNK